MVMAMPGFTFDSSKVKAALTNIARKAPEQVADALYAEAQIEMTEAKRRTPVDTGELRASGYVADPEIRGRRISVEMGFGGAASEYAVHVHEDLEALHPVGQAKYLESTVLESAPHMPARIARRLDLKDWAA
jgi:hypothetical protein